MVEHTHVVMSRRVLERRSPVHVRERVEATLWPPVQGPQRADIQANAANGRLGEEGQTTGHGGTQRSGEGQTSVWSLETGRNALTLSQTERLWHVRIWKRTRDRRSVANSQATQRVLIHGGSCVLGPR